MNKSAILLLCLTLWACKGKETKEVQTSLARRGIFSEELTEEGNIKAVNSLSINAPSISYRYGSLKITNMVEDGKEVQAGDTVVIFDPSEIKKAIVDVEQRLVIASAELEKLTATQESAIADMESDMEITRISQEISKINFEQSVFESDITKKEIALKLENANVALQRAEEQIVNRKKINHEDQFQKNISIKQLQAQLDEAKGSVSSLYVVSPSNGIAIIEGNWMSGQKWQIGDQPYSGTKLIELPDLREMLTEVKINEVDVSKIAPGMKAVIIADAYSDTSYTGEIITIANLAQNKDNKSKIKIFPVQIKIHGTPENLLPGLTVSCQIKIRELPDVVFIPLETLFKDQAGDYVYIKTGSGFKRKDVKSGVSNTDYIVVIEGLEGGEELAMSDPFLSKEDNSKKK